MPEYSESPAPSPKTLWDAQNELDWITRYSDHVHENVISGILKNGDLVEMKSGTSERHDRWYAHADSFGLLVTLAADLIN